jgi:hypothetical protein
MKYGLWLNFSYRSRRCLQETRSCGEFIGLVSPIDKLFQLQHHIVLLCWPHLFNVVRIPSTNAGQLYLYLLRMAVLSTTTKRDPLMNASWLPKKSLDGSRRINIVTNTTF